LTNGYPIRVVDAVTGPYSAANANNTTEAGVQTRILRATTGPTPTVSSAALNGALNSVEDTVRVIGLSGAYPVSVVMNGLTGITSPGSIVPMKVSSAGALFVELAAGSIGVTADISGATLSGDITIVGFNLGTAGTDPTKVVQIRGYTGPGIIPVTVTGTSFDIRGLSHATDSITVTGSVEFTNTSLAVTNQTLSELSVADIGSNKHLRVTDPALSTFVDTYQSLLNTLAGIQTKFDTANSGSVVNNNIVKVSVQSIAQPDGITSGRIILGPGNPRTFGSEPLKSGIHIKSDLGNLNKVVYVGTNDQVINGSGYPLYNGDQIFVETDNANRITLGTTDGATVYFIGT
jgi:hypothetical protein